MEHENWILLQWAFWLAIVAIVLAAAALGWLAAEIKRRRDWEQRHIDPAYPATAAERNRPPDPRLT